MNPEIWVSAPVPAPPPALLPLVPFQDGTQPSAPNEESDGDEITEDEYEDVDDYGEQYDESVFFTVVDSGGNALVQFQARSDIQLARFMANRYSSHQYKVEGIFVKLVPLDAESNRLPDIPATIKILDHDWSLIYVGGPYSSKANKTILVNSCPIPDWKPGAIIEKRFITRWANDPYTYFDNEILIKHDKEVVYVLGEWSDAIRSKIEATIKSYVDGTIDQNSTEFKAFARAMTDLRSKERQKFERRIRELTADSIGYRRQIVQILREIAELTLLVNGPKVDVNAGEMFDKIRAINDVRRVSIRGEVISAYTNQISIDDNGTIYNIGKFKISINVISAMVTIVNIDRLIDDIYHHPHICADEVCYGEIDNVIPDMVASLKIPELIIVLINFLKSFNRDSCYIEVEAWK